MLNVHSILSLGTVDGGGNRVVVFLQGCNLNCLYCHNPDSRSMLRKNIMSEDEVFNRILRYKAYWGENGGVTFSGGEPLIQAKAVLELTKRLKSEGIHTAIDTSGSVTNEYCDELIKIADLFLFDIKHTDPDEYKKLTGAKIDIMLNNLEKLKRSGTRFIVRQVIVPGLNDSEEQVLRLKELSKGAERVELLAYHTMGIEKWRELNIPYPLEGVLPPTKESMERLERLLET